MHVTTIATPNFGYNDNNSPYQLYSASSQKNIKVAHNWQSTCLPPIKKNTRKFASKKEKNQNAPNTPQPPHYPANPALYNRFKNTIPPRISIHSWTNVVFHNKDDLATGDFIIIITSELTWFFATKTVSPRGGGGVGPEPLVKRFLFTMKLPSNVSSGMHWCTLYYLTGRLQVSSML